MIPIPSAIDFLEHSLNPCSQPDLRNLNCWRWTDWERLYLPFIVHQDFPDVLDVKLGHDGGIWVKVADREEWSIPKMFGNPFSIQKTREEFGKDDQPIIKDGYVLMMGRESKFLTTRVQYETYFLGDDSVKQLADFISEPYVQNISAFMFLKLRDYLSWRSTQDCWTGYRRGDPLLPTTQQDYYEMQLGITFPKLTSVGMDQTKEVATNLRLAVAEYAIQKAKRLNRKPSTNELAIFQERTNAYWWIGKGNELRSIDCLVSKKLLPVEVADAWI